jgi:prolyl oligopeptidase
MHHPAYPVTRQVEQVDDYHGTKVPDPYRWLEDEASSETAVWVAAQQLVTEKYLSQLPLRRDLRMRVEQLADYPRYYEPIRRGSCIVFRKNDGLQSQLVLHVQRGLDGTPGVLIDPHEISADGTTRITTVRLSGDAHYLGYGLSYGGIDWEEYHVKDLVTRQDLPDKLQWVKFSTIAWHGHGFYYSRYPEPRDLSHTLSKQNEYHQVWYHKIGTPQSADTLVYEDKEHPLRFHLVVTTQDERFAVLDILDGAAGYSGNATWVLDGKQGKPTLTPVMRSFEAVFRVVDNEGGQLLVHTNRNAPNWRVVLVDPMRPDERHWVDIIPEGDAPLDRVSAAGTKLFGIYRVDATDEVRIFDRTGTYESTMALPGIGSVSGFVGQPQDTEVFWTSATSPPRQRRTCMTSMKEHPRSSSSHKQSSPLRSTRHGRSSTHPRMAHQSRCSWYIDEAWFSMAALRLCSPDMEASARQLDRRLIPFSSRSWNEA